MTPIDYLVGLWLVRQHNGRTDWTDFINWKCQKIIGQRNAISKYALASVCMWLADLIMKNIPETPIYWWLWEMKLGEEGSLKGPFLKGQAQSISEQQW